MLMFSSEFPLGDVRKSSLQGCYTFNWPCNYTTIRIKAVEAL